MCKAICRLQNLPRDRDIEKWAIIGHYVYFLPVLSPIIYTAYLKNFEYYLPTFCVTVTNFGFADGKRTVSEMLRFYVIFIYSSRR